MTAQYADDTAILNKSLRDHLVVDSRHIAMDLGWFSKWKIIASTNKSASPLRFVRLVDADIPWEPGARCLSVYLDPGLTIRHHFTGIVSKASKVFYTLYPMIARGSSLDLRNIILLYKMMSRPILTYASTIKANVPSRPSCKSPRTSCFELLQMLSSSIINPRLLSICIIIQ